MILIRIALAAAAAAALATPAFADDTQNTFDAFKQACGDTRADYAASVAAAAQGGWKTTDVMGNGMPNVTVTEKTARKKSAGDASLVLSMTHGTAAKDPSVNVYTCTLQTDRGSQAFAPLKAAVASWLGFEPASATDTVTTYRFTEDAGALKASTDFNSAAAGAGMMILTVKRDGNDAILDFVKIKK